MRAFVLCTGRCGSMTFVQACQHIDNYTAGHETLADRAGSARFGYPDDHIEADNRLTWFLGQLKRHFGSDPLYVHLRRDPAKVAESFEQRWDNGHLANIVRAFGQAIVPHPRERPESQRGELAQFYVDTVNANIEAFLASMPYTMTIDLEKAKEQFPEFWRRLGAEGDLKAALAEFDHRHNARRPDELADTADHRRYGASSASSRAANVRA